MTSSVPITQVRSDGQLRPLGTWNEAEAVLELVAPGFPLLGSGRHMIEGDLPWVFWDMCPSGFLGRRFARLEQHLSLNADPRTWTAAQALRALTQAGEDLSGNLLVGDESLKRWRLLKEREEAYLVQAKAFSRGETDQAPGLQRLANGQVISGARPWDPPLEIDAWLGGERPKLMRRNPNGTGSIQKFSPPLSTELGRRWADLLRMEAHCAETLRLFGESAVESAALTSMLGPRVVLEVIRFDRCRDWGRRGATTLYWYAMAEHGDVRLSAPEVIRGLVNAQHLAPAAAESVERVHAFSAALGNNDAHLANYGLLFDDEGRASVAPFFDILPMALAPLHDELPDARLRTMTPPTDEPVASWLHALVRRAEADPEISRPFLDLWRRHVGV